MLEAYRAKRDFAKTSEPPGDAQTQSGATLSFVVQMHRARRLHYDFRLELDGVLLSWATPKGPSLDPAEKRLAVRTEDHPLDYASFEGVIPAGEYGAGAVMVWDRGLWRPGKGDPRAALENGLLEFDLFGERLRGGFALTRLPRRGRETAENWLLVKMRDAFATCAFEATERWRDSAATGRDLDAIAAGRAATKKRDRTMPGFVAPQLATPADAPPKGEDWLHEIKFDGYRMIAALAGGRAQLFTRTGLDWTERFGSLAGSLAALPVGAALLDGEVVALDARGRSRFALLQEALEGGGEPLRYYVFDLLSLDGEDLRRRPLIDRKRRLKALLAGAPPDILFSDHLTGDGAQAFAEVCRMGLEGLVCKRRDLPYASRRTRGWIKVKCAGRDDFVIGGWRKSEAKHRPFASLLLGEWEDGALRYRGRVGTGFDAAQMEDIAARLRSLARRTAPFADAPRAALRGARWTQPKLTAEISYAERTPDGRLRHPVFLGLREDVAAPAPRPARAAPRPRLTHPDRILFPDAHIDKAGLAAYWRAAAPLALPHIAGRPLSLRRCPQGGGSHCFFQRHHAPGMPAGLLPLPLQGSEGHVEQFLMIEDAAGLEGAAQIGALELHIWGAPASNVAQPDRLVFDLDPDEGQPFETVKAAARDFRDLLAAMGLESFALLTGGKGMHIVAPIAPVSGALGWDRVKAFARGVAQRLAQDDPARFVAVMTKKRRKGKIYIDFLRNERAATAIAPYSPRISERAAVAAPIGWGELAQFDRADAYTIPTMTKRLASRAGRDPWAGYFDLRQSIPEKALAMFGA